jgi:hypothetical protein
VTLSDAHCRFSNAYSKKTLANLKTVLCLPHTIGNRQSPIANLLLLLSLSFCLPVSAAEFWVATDGSDRNPGTSNKPLASLTIATRKARELRRLNDASTASGIHIILRGGTYQLTDTLQFRSEDSGTKTSPTIVEAAPGEQPILSGGVLITSWQKVNSDVVALPSIARGNIWTADCLDASGRRIEVRQLWINDRKAVRAREPNGEKLNRLLTWDRTNHEAWVPNAALGTLRRPGGVEMIFHQQWEIAICRVKSFMTEGDRTGVTFQSPEGRLQFDHPWPQPIMSTNGNAPFFLANAIEFLDEPGEWYQELSSGKIYYWPRPDEDMSAAHVIAPALETLVQIDGTLDKPVAQLQFKGITFAHTTWLRPSHLGHVPLQAGMFLLDAYKLSPKGTPYHSGLDNQAWIGRPPAAVSVSGANHIPFQRCRFEHLASAGLDFQNSTHDDSIEGCVFRDIGGNGIQLGKFSDPGVETHFPYNPSDPREVCTGERIANNLVTDCANEDWGCVGICVGYGREISIEHNEVSNVSYTGIGVGWGWNKAVNCMSNNRIVANHVHHVATRMCDTAGIYTLSAQPGTLISGNSIHDIHMSPYVFDPNHWFYLYLDEGSSFITVHDNWCPEEKFLKNANGPGNRWENNGPMVSEKIRTAAGLEPDFRDLLPK